MTTMYHHVEQNIPCDSPAPFKELHPGASDSDKAADVDGSRATVSSSANSSSMDSLAQAWGLWAAGVEGAGTYCWAGGRMPLCCAIMPAVTALSPAGHKHNCVKHAVLLVDSHQWTLSPRPGGFGQKAPAHIAGQAAGCRSAVRSCPR